MPLIDADESHNTCGWWRVGSEPGGARAPRGLSDAHVGRLWAQILAGTRGGRTPHGVDGGARRTAADTVWDRLLALRTAFERRKVQGQLTRLLTDQREPVAEERRRCVKRSPMPLRPSGSLPARPADYVPRSSP